MIMLSSKLRSPAVPFLRFARHIFTPLPRDELVTKEKSRLRDRPYLPGSSDGGFPEFLAEPRESFPHAVQVQSDQQCSLRDSAVQCRKYIEENLTGQGAILFRNLPLSTSEDFSAFVRELGYDAMAYAGGVGQRDVIDRNASTYTASEQPKEETMELHNEMAYNVIYPQKLFFWCREEPVDGCGGETPLVNNSELLSKLDPDVMRKFQEKDILYWRCSPDKSKRNFQNWQAVFETEDRQVAEQYLTEQNYSFKWDENGYLFYWQILPAFRPHHKTNERVWFNQAVTTHASYVKQTPMFEGQNLPDHLYSFHTYYGDRSDIEPDVLQHIRAVTWQCAVGFRWRNGDLLTIDNMAVQHGRVAFTTPRKLLAFLSSNCKCNSNFVADLYRA